MNKAALEGQFGYFKMVLGMTRLLVDQFPADKITFQATPETRTVGDIIAHLYTFLPDSAAAAAAGAFNQSAEPKLTNKAETLAYMDSQVKAFYKTFAGLTDSQLGATIAAWGTEFKAWQFLGFAYDEHWHHRGQLTVLLRLCGVEPVMLYDYEKAPAVV